MKIGLLSDTHSFIDKRILDFFVDVDEIWHAGDIGSVALAQQLSAFKTFRAVYGNIDGADLRKSYPAELNWKCERLNVKMIHIGGYPGHYEKSLRLKLKETAPGLLICGHSHILKVMRDPEFGFLFMNPGAAGNYGWHKVKTALRFRVEKGIPLELEVLELERGKPE